MPPAPSCSLTRTPPAEPGEFLKSRCGVRTVTELATVSPVGTATELRNVICWDREQVTATIETEAVSPSPAVFFATHTPLRIYRTGPDGVRSDNPRAGVDEEAVRRDFL